MHLDSVMYINSNETPILAGLYADGSIWNRDGDILGRASDGAIVNIGDAGRLKQIEAYLRDHPTPDTW